MTTAQATIESVQVGDVIALFDGDVPFEVLAVGPVLGQVRQVDLVPVRGLRSRVRVTVALDHVVLTGGAADRELVAAG